MIKKLRIKLILVSMLSLLAVLVAIIGSINLMNIRRMISEADSVLDILAENDGRLPMQEEFTDPEAGPEYVSPEVPYESRYFFVLLDADGASLQPISSGSQRWISKRPSHMHNPPWTADQTAAL